MLPCNNVCDCKLDPLSLLMQVPKISRNKSQEGKLQDVFSSEHSVEEVSWVCFTFPPTSFSPPSSLISSPRTPSLWHYINQRAGHPAASTAEQCLGRVHVDTSALYPEGSTVAFFFFWLLFLYQLRRINLPLLHRCHWSKINRLI